MRRPSRSLGRVPRALAAVAVAGAAVLSMTAAVSAASVPTALPTPAAAVIGPPGASVPGATLPLPSPGSLLPPTPTPPPLPSSPTVCPACLPGSAVPPVSSGSVRGDPVGTTGAGSGSGAALPGGTSTGASVTRRNAAALAGAASGAGANTGLTAAGLHVVPPPVQSLGVVPGISFGSAPYLWPVFLVLDVLAAVLATVVIRRTWASSGD